MEQREVRLDYATDVYLIERLRKFELDRIEADNRARRALFQGTWSAIKIMFFIGGVTYALVKIFS